MNPLTLDAVVEWQAKGAQILDTRDPGEFGVAHLVGSINVGLGGQFATWAGTILDRTHPIVIIAAPGREHESALRLGRIGFDHVIGYLQDGLNSRTVSPELMAITERLTPQVAVELLSSRQAPLAIDVRAPHEHEQKHILGSKSIPLNRLVENLKNAAETSSTACLLCQRLPVIHRREPIATKRICTRC